MNKEKKVWIVAILENHKAVAMKGYLNDFKFYYAYKKFIEFRVCDKKEAKSLAKLYNKKGK